MDRAVGLPRGFAYVEYETRVDAERAKLHMDGGQLDGNVITCGPTCSSAALVIHYDDCKPRSGLHAPSCV